MERSRFPLPGAKFTSRPMEAGPVCDRGGALPFGGRAADAEAGSTADALRERVPLHEALHLEELQQLLVERKAGVEIAHGKLDVRDAVKLHRLVLTANGEAGRAQSPGSC